MHSQPAQPCQTGAHNVACISVSVPLKCSNLHVRLSIIQNQLHGTPQQSHQHLGQGPTSVAMMNQQSQQGTNTSGGGSRGTSANASPTNKRRRHTSPVKQEGDEAPEINGTGPAGQNKVKASPRGGIKRQKGNG